MIKRVVLVMFMCVPMLLSAQKEEKDLQIVSLQTDEKSFYLVSVEENNQVTKVQVPGAVIVVDHYGDTITKISFKKRRLEIIENYAGNTKVRMVHSPPEKFAGHWEGISLGLNNFGTTYFSTELPQKAGYLDLNTGKSIEVGINLFQQNISLQRYKNNIGLVTGLGLTLNNYRFDTQYRLTRNAEGLTDTVGIYPRWAEKNKLLLRYVTVPLLFEFQIPDKNKHHFYVNAGIYGSFKFSSHVKIKHSDNMGAKKVKYREDFNINPFKYGVMARAGYRFVNIYATTDLSGLFNKKQGIEIYPWSIGIMLVCF